MNAQDAEHEIPPDSKRALPPVEANARIPGSLELEAVLSLLFSLVLAMVVVWMVVSALAVVSDYSDRARRRVDRQQAIEVLKTHLVDVETGERGYLITGDPRYLEPYQSALSELDQHRRRLAEMYSDEPGVQTRLRELFDHIDKKLAIAQSNVAVREQGGVVAQQHLLHAGGKQEMDAVRALLDGMLDENWRELSQLREQRMAALDALKRNIFIAASFLVAVLLWFHFRLLRLMRQRRAAEVQAQHMATHDSLTGLPNRRMLISHLERAILRSARHQKLTALLFLDLDGFKPVNDQYGHLAGDELLQQVAQRLTAQVRATDMAARLGGDEFVLLLEDIDAQDGVCHVIGKVTREIGRPFTLRDGASVRISASIGVAVYPEDGADVTELLKRADDAMYTAKRTGSNCHCHDTGPAPRCIMLSSQPESTLK